MLSLGRFEEAEERMRKLREIRWLAETKGPDVIPPGDLLGLSLTVKDFLEKAKKLIVMLQGIEYLTTYNGFTPILRLINKQDEALLTTETTPMPMPAAR